VIPVFVPLRDVKRDIPGIVFGLTPAPSLDKFRYLKEFAASLLKIREKKQEKNRKKEKKKAL